MREKKKRVKRGVDIIHFHVVKSTSRKWMRRSLFLSFAVCLSISVYIYIYVHTDIHMDMDKISLKW